jgi:hypothetical protein
MAGKPTTQNVIRVTVTRMGKAISGPNADGTKTVAVRNIVSAFGPQNLGNVYCVKVAGDYEFPAKFDLRNAQSNLWLGTWEVLSVSGTGVNATLWDMTTAQQTPDGSKPGADVPATAPVAPTAVTEPSAPSRIAAAGTGSRKLQVGFGGFNADEVAKQIGTRPYGSRLLFDGRR